MTEDIRRFQRSHLDCFGRPLVPDGRFGPLTNWAVGFEEQPRNVKRVIHNARLFLGVEEIDNTNRGAEVDKFLAPANVGLGHPWCCAFVSYILARCGELQHPSGTYFVSVHAFSNAWTSNHAHVPTPGDVFIIKRSNGTGHVGFVIGVSDAEIMTIEGNVQNGVRVGRRDRSNISHYVSLNPTVNQLEVNDEAPDFDGAPDR